MTPQSDLTPAGATSLGVIGRITGIYFSPSETYPVIGRAPKWILPIILVGILGALQSFALTNRVGFDNLLRKQFEPMVEKGWMTQEQADEALRNASSGSARTVGQLQGPVFILIGYALFILALTGIFKLISMIVGAESDFKPLLGVTAWTFLALGVLQMILFLIVIYLKEPDDIDLINPVGSNLGALVSVFSTSVPKFVKALATWVDFFGIWRIFLLSIGYAAVSRKLKTGTAAIFLVVLYVICAVIFSAIAAMFT